MIEDLGGVTSSLVKMALDVAALRHQAIANNIANADTQGFKPQYVSFEEHLSQLVLQAPNQRDDARLAVELEGVQARIEQGELLQTSKNGEVHIDLEMAKLSENVIRYQALLAGLSKRGAVLKMAISEGRG